MLTLKLLKRLYVLLCILIGGCVTYTPVNVPAIPPIPVAKQISPPATIRLECVAKKLTPLPPIEAPLNLRIEKGDEPAGDENGVELITVYVNAQKEIRAHNKIIEQCKIK